MQNYIDLVERIIFDGEERADRTGVGTLSVFGGHIEWDLRERFPLVTAKETRWRTAFLEMLFFLTGQTNVKWLNERGSKLWDEWADHNGNLGPVYGFNWRRWGARPDNAPQPKPRLRGGVEPTYLGVANGRGKGKHRLGKTWEGMIARCYDVNSASYNTYGAKGVHVCDRWLEFAAFAEDAAKLPGYRHIGTGEARLVLDKDTMGNGFIYSPETCCWLTDIENAAAKAGWLYTVEKDGQRYSFTNTLAFCRERGIEAKNFSDLWTGNKNAVERCGFRLVGRERIRRELDQVRKLIDGLKSDPLGRRHIVSAWNVADLGEMALPPCHAWHQCYAGGDEWLDMQVYQRSWDVALGAPFNICAYALLLHLYARATGRKPRRLAFCYGDAHIYLNHVEQMRKVAEDGPVPSDNAKLEILTDNTDIDGYTIDDFRITGYSPRGFVAMPVAV